MKRLKKGLALFLTLALFTGLAAPAGIRAQADSPDDGLLLHYDFSGLSGELTAGTQVADLSGNGHAGTVQGSGASAEDGVPDACRRERQTAAPLMWNSARHV